MAAEILKSGELWICPYPDCPGTMVEPVDSSTILSGAMATIELYCPDCGDIRSAPADIARRNRFFNHRTIARKEILEQADVFLSDVRAEAQRIYNIAVSRELLTEPEADRILAGLCIKQT